jgi:ATP-binding cassette subfamily B protein
VSRPPTLLLTRAGYDRETDFDARPLSLALIRRLLRYTRPYRVRRSVLLALVLVRAVQLPALAWSIGAVVNGPVARRDPAGMVWGVAGFLGLLLSTSLIMRFRQRLALELGEAVVHDVRRDLFDHLLAMPMAFFDRTRLGRIISRFSADTEAVRVGVQDVLFVSLVQIGQMVVSGLLMLWYDPLLFGVVLLTGPLLWTINRHFRVRLSRAHREVRESFARVTAAVAEAVMGVREIQGCARQDVNAGLFRALVSDHAQYNVSVARAEGRFFPLLELNTQCFISALVLVGGYRVMQPEATLSLGSLIQFFFLANLFFAPIQSLANQYSSALTAMAGAERVFGFLDTPPEWTDAPTATPLDAPRGAVEFRGVHFAYRPDRPALHGVSFRVEPGQTVALVGRTGSGKTTVIRLLAKFYLPSSGDVRVDGRNLLEVRSDSLHRHMGIVLQSNFLFSGTVLENVLLGRPGAGLEEACAAARSLDCLDWFETLPRGFETPVGERGSGLSLGQRQLVCFARAMLADPAILVLDEATSAVDPVTEARLQRALHRLTRGRTSFIVAHRLSTIRHADQVLVLEGGRVIEQGNHRSLLAANGAYAALYRQFMSLSGAALAGTR